MNKINKIAALACIALMGGMSACTDGNDWGTDGSYAGTFRPTSISCEQTGKGETTVLFTFGSVPGATSYEIEAATDTITADEVNPDNIVAVVTKSPATVDGFKMETTYWTRIRAISPSGTSKWIASKKFTTEAINVINKDLTENTMTSITVRWTGGTALTKATVEKQEELVREFAPTEKEKAAGEMKITELQPATIYTIKLWNGDNRVGMVSVTTQSGGPTGDYNITFDASRTMGEQLADVAAKAAEDGNAEYSVTVIIPAGVEAKIADKPAEDSTDDASALTLPNGMSVTFYGERGNAMDVVSINNQLNLDGRHSVVKFQNLTVTGTGYLLNQKSVCNVDSVIIEDCEVSGFIGSTFVRTQGGTYDAANAIGCLKLANSTFDNCGKGYGFIHVDGTIINNIDIDGCTFSNICTTGKCFFMQSKYVQSIESMSIKNSTFYNYCGNGQYFIDFKDKSTGPATFELSNCIFGKTADEITNKNVRGTCDVADFTSNCKLLSDCFKVIKGADKLEDKSSADIFTDPDNGDFTLKSGCGIEKCGDPRWY